MKKRLVTVIGLAAVSAAVLSGSAFAAPAATGQYIGEAKAKSAALAHAGVTEQQATFIKSYLDYDDGRVVYDVEFYSGNTEYDYEIDAVSGTIREYDKDIEYYSIPSYPSSALTGTDQYISEAEARAAALKSAGVTEQQATFIKSYLDYDDGFVVYDVEFYSGSAEYDYEIDAVSGAVLGYDKDIEYYSVPTASSAAPAGTGQYIGESAAKAAALKHASVTEQQVTFIKAHLDGDDGRVVYDIEFYSGDTEYDYEIDAVSGEIFEYDREIEYRRAQNASSGAPNTSAGQTSAAGTGQYIGEAKAKSIALTAAGFSESQVRRLKADLDREHRTMVYEVDFKNGLMEYEYEIDAVSGAILKSDVEYDD